VTRWRNSCGQEILPIIEQKQARIVGMPACPGGGVERGPQSVAGVEGDANSALKLENGSEPKRPQQDIA